MSLGPEAKDENAGIEIKLIDKTTNAAKKILTVYFADPIHYIFYGAITATVVGLLCGRSFPSPLYYILGALSIIKLFSKFDTSNVQSDPGLEDIEIPPETK